MNENNGQEQPTKVVEMNETKSPKKSKAGTEPKPSEQVGTAPKEALFVITETHVNQLLNTIAELPGLTWKQTNPIIAFIRQNVRPVGQ